MLLDTALRLGGEPELTAAELRALGGVPEDEFECVRVWRYEELRRVGYDEEDAAEIAFHLDIDLHKAADLRRRGCPSAIAASIML